MLNNFDFGSLYSQKKKLVLEVLKAVWEADLRLISTQKKLIGMNDKYQFFFICYFWWRWKTKLC